MSRFEPDPLKIKYREALIETVQAVVRGLKVLEPQTIAQLAGVLLPTTDQRAFAQLIAEALRQLHEGSVVRWRLKRSEFLAWQGLQR